MRKSLIEFMTQVQMPMTTNGALNGGPLSAALPAKNEGGIKNKNSKKPKMFRMNDKGDDEYPDYDYEMDADDTDYPDYDTDMSDVGDKKLFKNFIDFMNQNMDLIHDAADDGDMDKYNDDDMDNDPGMDMDMYDDEVDDMDPEAEVDMDPEAEVDDIDPEAEVASSEIDLYGKSPIDSQETLYDKDEEEEFDSEMPADAAGVGMDQADGYPEMNDEDHDPDKQGAVRVVRGAHLLYKRESADGLFDELWFYNTGKEAVDDPDKVKKDILAGTDIHQNQTRSDDGTQNYELWTCGNGQMVKIQGLPN